MAANQKAIHIVEVLLTNDANPNLQNNYLQTPLHLAIYNLEMAQLLLKYGANPNIQDKDGKTVLHYMVEFVPNFNIIRILVSNGIDPKIKDNKGNMAIQYISGVYRREFEKIFGK
jgi:ankyrin repeat protein